MEFQWWRGVGAGEGRGGERRGVEEAHIVLIQTSVHDPHPLRHLHDRLRGPAGAAGLERRRVAPEPEQLAGSRGRVAESEAGLPVGFGQETVRGG